MLRFAAFSHSDLGAVQKSTIAVTSSGRHGGGESTENFPVESFVAFFARALARRAKKLARLANGAAILEAR